jgi:uncharacterized SAM-binding protein YcdF (DUF218 family)
VVLLAAAIFLFRTVWLTWLGDFLVVDQPPFQADMIAVLGGDLRGTRILKAAELCRQGYAPLVLVSGAGNIYGLHESDLAIRWAVQHGYRGDLFIPFHYPAESTRDEEQAVIRELRARHVKRVILVTSNFHTRRASLIFRQLAPDIALGVVASPDQYFSGNGWWKTREGEKTMLFEWTKTVSDWFGI